MKTAELACELNELKIEHVAIDSLHPDPANPRRIGERELEALTRSLQQFGFVQPVLVRKSDNVVIGGHQRLVAARRLGSGALGPDARRPQADRGHRPEPLRVQ